MLFSCFDLQTVRFPLQSRLQIINDYAFYYTKITSIKIPTHFTLLKLNAFCGCNLLETVTFCENSKLNIIGDSAFSSTAIKSITIPSHVTDINYNVFYDCNRLTTIQFYENQYFKFQDGILLKKSDQDDDFFDIITCLNIQRATIPLNVKNVLKNCFSSCENLQIIEFLPNSGPKIIEDCAFSSAAITSITIPPHVTEIKSNVFNNCNSLREVFCENSELTLIVRP